MKTELFHTKTRLAPTSREGFVTLPSPLPHNPHTYTHNNISPKLFYYTLTPNPIYTA